MEDEQAADKAQAADDEGTEPWEKATMPRMRRAPHHMGQAALGLLLRLRALHTALPGPPHEGRNPQLECEEKHIPERQKNAQGDRIAPL